MSIEVVPVTPAYTTVIPLPLACEPASAMADSFRVLRRRLKRLGDPRVIAVSSPRRREGKTTCAVGLAMAIAEDEGDAVLLIEGNLRRPCLARALGFTPPVCLARQLAAFAAREASHWTAADIGFHRLQVLAVDPASEVPVLTTAALRPLIDCSAVCGYRHVIIDGPGVFDSADMQVIQDQCDGVLLSARSLRTKASELRRAAADLAPAELIGAVLVG